VAVTVIHRRCSSILTDANDGIIMTDENAMDDDGIFIEHATPRKHRMMPPIWCTLFSLGFRKYTLLVTFLF
jgi:hypothetical protein